MARGDLWARLVRQLRPCVPWALEHLRQGREAIPYENAELLACAATDNGDVCYWLRTGAEHADRWTIVVNEPRGPRWAGYDGGLVEFLAAALTGRHTVDVFPVDLPSNGATFGPY